MAVKRKQTSKLPSKGVWGPLRSLLALSPVLIGAPLLALKLHYALPVPFTELYNPATNTPQISETRILQHAQHLSETIGFRTVGTSEHAQADAWMVQQAEEIKRQCEEAVARSGGTRKLECEVWRQEGSGSHRFDMMSKRLYKTYVNLSNIVIRISAGTPESKAHAVLVNAHLDSTLPSPGAADDALSVGVMLECARVLVAREEWEPEYAIILLFNHAEESLQDASHLYSTQHPTRDTVRAVINLEAAGTTGRELLFQATSEQMIQAYSHVPRPFGTVFANDVFSSGVLLSDTDFRQFEQYLNVTGLDMAVVGNSYLYHMRKDLVENIQPGVAQHMGENTLALLEHLSSAASPLPELTAGYSRPTTVFFSHLGWFFVYSFATARILYSALLAATLVFVYLSYADPAPALKKGVGRGVWSAQVRGAGAIVLGVLGAIVLPNVQAAVMQRVLGKGMSWFSSEVSTIVLYGPTALAGALASQLLVSRLPEHVLLTSLLLLQAGASAAIQLVGYGSAAMFFLTAAPLLASLVLDTLIRRKGQTVTLWAYALGSLTPLLTGAQLMSTTLDVFVPLTGRIGADAPADNVIATIVAILCAHMFPLVLPFAHRFPRAALRRSVGVLGVAIVIVTAVFAARSPFDAMHQKRLFVLHTENVTTHERHLHISTADGAPGYDALVQDIARTFGRSDAPVHPIVMDDYNSDWDSLYPFSAFLTPYKIELPAIDGAASPWSAGDKFTVTAENDVVDEAAGTRSLTLRIDHPGIIWTVIAFDAHVLKWTLDDNPPAEYARHHIKEASFYGIDTWSVDLVLQLPASGSPALAVNYVGVQEQGMWPAKKAEKEGGGQAMALFEDFDAWLEEKTGGTVEPLLLGSIGGIAVV
ncbi:hypothetical protein PLICRDRAFT_180757 [Plicaturopsis crispa FD-325 SS-3]|uniref:Peptide hydrolase n=1 Tax=Plicaturopsis crispa FD-325 SS-3 TaxID=944288 RepID=A0A0C9T4L9_PLICR|nr:hypothetical protein PLICRDRAFT_180757 [Plicaturopsis crispa FD-325 SS-3]